MTKLSNIHFSLFFFTSGITILFYKINPVSEFQMSFFI